MVEPKTLFVVGTVFRDMENLDGAYNNSGIRVKNWLLV
jgi:hypothetical protein